MATGLEDKRLSDAHGPFSMTDEEGDFSAYQEYLRTLTPEALWDVHAHLDEDRYPRRADALRREIARRRLFFFAPYTVSEFRLRLLFSLTLLCAIAAVALHHIPTLSAAVNQFSEEIGGMGVSPTTGRRFVLITGLSMREHRVLDTLSAFFRGCAWFGIALSVPGILIAAVRLARHRLRPDILLMGVLALLFSLGLLYFGAVH
jgi:hypothetical protein